MKTILTCALLLIAAGSLPACSGSSPAASTPIAPPAAAIAGVDTPRSVSVVTAN
jgi:hypothetical protein